MALVANDHSPHLKRFKFCEIYVNISKLALE